VCVVAALLPDTPWARRGKVLKEKVPCEYLS